MTKVYKPLTTIFLNASAPVAHPPSLPEIVHLEDPATTILYDFKTYTPITITPMSPIADAAMEMRVCHTHFLLVVNEDSQVVGLISSEDILGEKAVKYSLERRIKRADIMVRMLMIPEGKIAVISLKELQLAKVGNVIATLHSLQQHYALVVEVDETTRAQTIRGVLSLHQISKQLGEDVTFDLSEAPTLYELQRGLRDKT